ncbi:LysR family transcriptional regulator, partial [Vibrio vulnificus Env1]
VQEDIKQQRLVTVLNGYMKNFNASTSSAGVDLNVIYLSRQYQPKRLRLFIDFLLAQFQARFPAS